MLGKVGVRPRLLVPSSPESVPEAARLVASVSRGTPFVIQPVTPTSAAIAPPAPPQLLELQLSALEILDDVRIVPQVHRLMGQK